MAEIIPLPLARKACSDCSLGYLGDNGVYCIEFHQFVDEEEANTCEGYNPTS